MLGVQPEKAGGQERLYQVQEDQDKAGMRKSQMVPIEQR